MAALAAQSGKRKLGDLNSDKKICKIYVVLHGQGIRARDDSINEGNVGSDEKPNFFVLGEGLDDSVDIKLFRMVAPGMVFMSHIDINKEFREKLLKYPLDDWLHILKINTTLTPQQFAAPSHHSKADGPEYEKNVKSRAIFRQLLQLFNKGDRLTNERLLSDFDTREAQQEFGVWITEEGKEYPTDPIISSTDKKLLGDFGTEKEITLQDLINQIIKLKKCSHYEFYIANCSPIPSDDRAVVGRLQKDLTASKWNRPGQFSAVALNSEPRNINFWLNTLYIHYKRLKNYHLGKANLNSFITGSGPQKQEDVKGKRPQVPPTDTIWGMMDSEERQDHYKLIRGLLLMYPHFLKDSKVNKKEIKDMMIFIIKTITTPFNEKIRDGEDYEKGASQITKYSGAIENKTGSGGASKVGEGYYTLSEGVASQIAPVIEGDYVIPGLSAEEARSIISDYEEMLKSVYGMGRSKDGTPEVNHHISPNYPFKSEKYLKWKELIPVQGGGNKLKKKRKTLKKKRKKKKKTRRKKKKKRKNKTRKKKRRIKRKKTRRRKSK